MKKLLFAIVALLSTLPAFAQVTISVANAGTTGTTVNTLTKVTSAPATAVIAATTDTGGVIGITIAGAGTSGNAIVAISGLVPCVFDGSTTANDYVKISSLTGGDCSDTGSTTYPTTGQIIGRVLSTNGAAGTYTITLFTPEIQGIPSSSIVPFRVGVSDVTGQSTSQSTVTVATPGAGRYQLQYYADLNTACTTGANSVSFTFNWTDASAARALTTGSMSMGTAQLTSSYMSGVIPLQVGSASVTYTSTIAGACSTGSSSYDVHVVLEKMQ